MAIVYQGNYTVGSGGDFPAWGGAAGACANVGNLTGNLTFTGLTSTTETGIAYIANKIVGAHTLTLDGNSDHLGNPTGGLINSFTSTASYAWSFDTVKTSGAGKIIITNFSWKDTGTIDYFFGFYTGAAYDPTNIEFSDILFNGNSNTYYGWHSRTIDNTNSVISFKNVNIWNCRSVLFNFQLAGCNINSENCNAYSTVAGSVGFNVTNGTTDIQMRNCTSDCMGNDFAGINTVIGNNNSSADATAANANWAAGANNIINQVTANNVISTDDTNEAFFEILFGGAWGGTGIVNTLTRTTDIFGEPVPFSGSTSIGVSERHNAGVVTSGSYTVGSGGDFPAWGGAAGALANTGTPLTGNLTFTGLTSTIENAAINPTINVGVYTLTLDGNSGHAGDPTSGLLTSCNSGGEFIYFRNNNSTGAGKVVIKDFRMTATGANVSFFRIWHTGDPNNCTYEVNDLLLDNNSNVTQAFKLYSISTTTVFKIQNCSVRGGGTGFVFWNMDGILTAENNNVYNCSTGYTFIGTTAGTNVLNNNTGCDNTTDFNAISTIEGNNNSSSDATADDFGTGSGNLINQTTTDNVLSVSDASSDFFAIKFGGAWSDAGITNTLIRTTDIFGRPVPGSGGTSIGVSERYTGIVTSGNYSVGLNGDFPAWGGAAGACANVGNLTGNLTFTQITATTETASGQVTTKTIGQYTLTYDSATPHNGDPTSGLLIDQTQAGTNIFGFSNCVHTTGKTVIKNLYMKTTSGTATDYHIFLYMPSSYGNYEFTDLLFDGNSKCYRGIYTSNLQNSKLRMTNCNGWDLLFGIVDMVNYVGDGVIENCNCYNSGTGFYIQSRILTINNCTGCDNTTDFSGIGNCTGNNNSSSDGTATNGNWSTGANNIINQVTANCVESTDDTNSNFFNITESCPWDGAGITNTITRPYGIRGNVVPGLNGTSIGVAELETIPTGDIAITSTIPEVSISGFSGTLGTASITSTIPQISVSGAIGNNGSAAIAGTIPQVSVAGQMEVFGTVGISGTIPQIELFGSIAVFGTVGIMGTIPLLNASGYFSILKVVEKDSKINTETTINSLVDIG